MATKKGSSRKKSNEEDLTQDTSTELALQEQEVNTLDSSDDSEQEIVCVFEDGKVLDNIQEFLVSTTKKIDTHDLIFIDIAHLEEVTTAAVQAMISLNRYALTQNKKIKWQNPSNSFSDAFNNLGFYSEMMKLEFA